MQKNGLFHILCIVHCNLELMSIEEIIVTYRYFHCQPNESE